MKTFLHSLDTHLCWEYLPVQSFVCVRLNYYMCSRAFKQQNYLFLWIFRALTSSNQCKPKYTHIKIVQKTIAICDYAVSAIKCLIRPAGGLRMCIYSCVWIAKYYDLTKWCRYNTFDTRNESAHLLILYSFIAGRCNRWTCFVENATFIDVKILNEFN